MGFKTQDGFQFTGVGDGLKFVSGKRISFYLSEQGDAGEEITSTVPTDNLEVYVKPSDYSSGTTVVDSSGNNRTYDLKNGVAHNTFPARFTFDGTNDYLEAASDYNIVTNTATFVAWVKRNGTQDSYAGLMFNRTGSVSGMHFYSTEHTIGYHWNNAMSTWGWDSEVIIPDGLWALVALTVSSTEVQAYLYTTTVTPTQSQNSNSHGNSTIQNVEIGRDPDGNRDFKGDMGHFLFYSATLSQSQLTSLYNATREIYYPTSIYLTSLEFCIDPSLYISGTTVVDSSGNNRNYTLYNGVTHNTSPNRFTLDGTNDYLGASANYSVPTANATFVMWIKRDGEQSSYTGLMLERANIVSGMNFYSTTEEIGYMINGSHYQWDSNLEVADGVWTMVAITVNTSTAVAYRYTTSTTPSTATRSAYHGSSTYTNLLLGQDSDGGRYFKGDIGHSMFYSATLTESELTSIYNSTKAIYGY
mgnify:CR=1 FL=1|tara:strand:+ start:1217 stop:2632 length:1416 start_codon:yes stop_codon:yes gene_type:complete